MGVLAVSVSRDGAEVTVHMTCAHSAASMGIAYMHADGLQERTLETHVLRQLDGVTLGAPAGGSGLCLFGTSASWTCDSLTRQHVR